jgi:hypothetical protein
MRWFLKLLSAAMLVAISISGLISVAPAANATVDAATVVSTPNPAGPTLEQRIWSVSCSGVDFCAGVGSYSDGANDQTLALLWNGQSWSQVNSPNPAGPSLAQQLLGVHCVSSNWCIAVGWYGVGVYTQELALLWDGSAWTQMDTSNIGGNLDDQFRSVSCNSTTSCMAVGETNTGSATANISAHWDGSHWTELAIASPGSGSSVHQLWGVSCATAQWCAAVGVYLLPGYNTMAFIWNGSTWTSTQIPLPGGSSRLHELNGVSCLSPTWCVAVGRYNDGVADRSMVLQWNGSTWSLVSSPNVGVDQRNVLNGVDCRTTEWCVAVGRYQNGTTSQTLVQQWNGSSWVVLDSPNVGTDLYNVLYSVSCPVDWNCAAVGRANNGVAAQNLAIALTGPPPPSTTTTTSTEPIAPAFTG